MQTRTKIITATSLTGLFIASLFPAPSFAVTELYAPPPVVAPAGPALEIERASFTADIAPSALPVFELDGISMLETPPLILAGQTETEEPSEEAESADKGEHDDEVAEPTGEEEISVEPLASGSTALGAKLVKTGKKYLGVPYLWGGTDPARGLDCSGFVQLVGTKTGISLPRLARQQAKVGTKVKNLKSARPGDLIGMRNGKHIAIYIGANRILHSPQPGSHVSIRKLTKNDDVDVIRRLK